MTRHLKSEAILYAQELSDVPGKPQFSYASALALIPEDSHVIELL